MTESRLEREEPNFAEFWLASHAGSDDPQMDRWIEIAKSVRRAT